MLIADPDLDAAGQSQLVREQIALVRCARPDLEQLVVIAEGGDAAGYLAALNLGGVVMRRPTRPEVAQAVLPEGGRVFVRAGWPQIGVRGIFPVAVYLDGYVLRERDRRELPEIVRWEVPGAFVMRANQPRMAPAEPAVDPSCGDPSCKACHPVAAGVGSGVEGGSRARSATMGDPKEDQEDQDGRPAVEADDETIQEKAAESPGSAQ